MTEKQKPGIDLDELQTEVEKLLELMKDRHPGQSTWNEFLAERLANIQSMANQALPSPLPKKWGKLLSEGWKIVACSCACGGRWAWMKPRPSGAHGMHGCVCHNTP